MGNGSSLKKTNLDLLIGQPSMAVNKIHMHYDKTKWRPTHYLKIDYSAFDKDDWKSEILTHINAGEQCLLWDAFREGADKSDGNYEFIYDGVGSFPNVRYVERCKHHYQNKAEWHHFCTGLNSIVSMVIWAVELGYSEIILVGCDGKFTNPKEDHFTEDYYRTWDFDYERRNNNNVTAAHELIRKKCPIQILDATVGGHLTQYQKVRLEDVVG